MELVTISYIEKEMKTVTICNCLHPKTLRTILQNVKKHNWSDYVLIGKKDNNFQSEMFRTVDLLAQIQILIEQKKEFVKLQPVSWNPFVTEDEENILA